MMVAAPLLRAALFGAVGLALGAAHFSALHANARLYLGGARARRAVGLHALRMALVIAALLGVARFGGLALVAAFAGLLLARRMVTASIVSPP